MSNKLFIATILILLTVLFLAYHPSNNKYTASAKIKEAGYTYIVYETENGNTYTMYGNYAHEEKGKSVVLTFHNNNIVDVDD